MYFYGITVISLLCVHIFQNRKDFRPAYSKLDYLGSVLPGKPIVGLTATATKEARLSIAHSLGMINPVIIEVSSDRRNIYFSSSRRPNSGEDKLEGILGPLAEELLSKRSEFPLRHIWKLRYHFFLFCIFLATNLESSNMSHWVHHMLQHTDYSHSTMPNTQNRKETG